MFASTAAHYSVAKNADLLGMRLHLIPADDRGEIRYDLLHAAVTAHGRRGAVVVATVGTTMTEAVDDVPVAPPSGPLALYRVKIDGAHNASPARIVKVIEGAAVWVPAKR